MKGSEFLAKIDGNDLICYRRPFSISSKKTADDSRHGT